MQKINFQDTEVVKAPYVEINGVEYEVESEYQGGTDLNAETFNQMQDNIEDAIDNIPLYDDTELKTGWYELPVTATLTYSSWDNTNKIGVLTTSVDLTGNLGIGTKLKFYNVTGYKYAIIIAMTSSTITIYLGNQTLIDGGIEFLRYAITETPIDYPVYMSSLDKLYLPIEIPIGVHFGKILYRNVIYKTSGFSTGEQEVQHGISNVSEFIDVKATLHRGDGEWEPVPAVPPSNYLTQWQASVYDFNSSRFRMFLGSSMTGTATVDKMYLTLEYTKTTD